MNVRAFCTSFPDSYRTRLCKLDIPTTKVMFYTLSLEDLVVSKLCSFREKDAEDVENPLVSSSLDWDLLDRLVEEVCYGMLRDDDAVRLRERYHTYKEKFQ